jgi:hypothetical protein
VTGPAGQEALRVGFLRRDSAACGKSPVLEEKPLLSG